MEYSDQRVNEQVLYVNNLLDNVHNNIMDGYYPNNSSVLFKYIAMKLEGDEMYPNDIPIKIQSNL